MIELNKLALVIFSLIIIIGIFYERNYVVLSKEPDKIENFSEKSDAKFVLFYAPWCGHCKSIKPTWEKLTKNYPNIVTEINCDEEEEVAKANNIQGYPTIKYFPAGMDGDSIDYEGSRDYKSIESFLNKQK